MPSCSPNSQWGLGVKVNWGGVPQRRTSTLSSADWPRGTESCGILGMPARTSLNSCSSSLACFSKDSPCSRKARFCSTNALVSCPDFFSRGISSEARFLWAFKVSAWVMAWRRRSSRERKLPRTFAGSKPRFRNISSTLGRFSRTKARSSIEAFNLSRGPPGFGGATTFTGSIYT